MDVGLTNAQVKEDHYQNCREDDNIFKSRNRKCHVKI